MDEPAFKQQAHSHGCEVQRYQKHNKDHVLVCLLNFDLISTSTESVDLHRYDDRSNNNA